LKGTLFTVLLLTCLVSAAYGQSVLRVPAGERHRLEKSLHTLDTLWMGSGARLFLSADDVALFIDHAYLEGNATIYGLGVSGQNGAPGAPGMDGTRERPAENGEAGKNGENGQRGTNLSLYINFEKIEGTLTIDLSGGQGGDAGDGGNGGNQYIKCGAYNQGTNGGDAGLPGTGGRPGELELILGNQRGRDRIKKIARFGGTGREGTPGQPGGTLAYECDKTHGPLNWRPGRAGTARGVFPSVGSTSNLPEDHLNFGVFPENPPAASDRLANLPMGLKDGDTFGDVYTRIMDALEFAQYRTPSIQRWRDGFALITQIEQIYPDGRPLEGYDRWSQEIKVDHSPSILSYLKSLIFAQRGYFRVIVFLAGERDGLLTSSRPVSREEALAWFQTSVGELPSDLYAKSFGPDHRVSVLVYEFVKQENQREPYITDPVRLSVEDHLEQSFLWRRLKKAE
jgi:hypothetical protein